MLRNALLLALLPAALLAAPADSAVTTERVATGLNRPVFVTAPEGDDRLFIVEQRGRILILDSGTVLTRPFLDIETLVDDSQNEQGLLGLAFHPDYETNGEFFVYFTTDPAGINPDVSVVRRYQVSSDPDSADAASGVDVIRVDQDFSNHNGGTIAFAADGTLYWGLGDGGSGGDPNNRAQTGTALLGKMLRLDVDGDDFPGDATANYAIPVDNPFVGNPAFRDEIWAFGLRNPYRWSFDRLTQDLWIGDVGQNVWEEIDFQKASSPGGENYGWRCWEGNHVYNDTPPCLGSSIVFPIREYSHSQDGFSCSVTGGYVYRGADLGASWEGVYWYADYCSNQIYSLRYDSGTGMVSELTNRTAELAPSVSNIREISGFGEDGFGELYIVDLGSSSPPGQVFKIVPDAVDAPDVNRPTLDALGIGVPNPFDESTRFAVRLDRSEDVRVDVYDAAGRHVRRLEEANYPAGEIAVAWDGRDGDGEAVPAGVYFVRARIGDQLSTRRVVRLR